MLFPKLTWLYDPYMPREDLVTQINTISIIIVMLNIFSIFKAVLRRLVKYNIAIVKSDTAARIATKYGRAIIR